MARPRKFEGEIITFEKILNAARLEFADQSHAARLEDIGKRCGLTRTAILHHFGSKKVLLDAVFEQAVNNASARVLRVAQANEDNYAETIRSIALALRQLEKDEPGTSAVVAHVLLTKPVVEPLKKIFQDLLGLITRLVIKAGGGQHHSHDLIRAAIAHIFMGELNRLALGTQAQDYWGEADPLMPILNHFFQLPTL
ncbi:TetR/AcrR family transcriptional regulator [Aquirhabdus parva]|uniref:TetR/AcrR family transcriptional regulator n=1 Tax=Aquirhabdus parva TaxID=2283318 RepID=A0A345P9G4_9GAMM|nr:TetR/AcrR family transcriptional regulator [Aquirhabdus parva]AXI03923.1 TetR/AcrR family transcriptional regulator [Aquirhabdus parva]